MLPLVVAATLNALKKDDGYPHLKPSKQDAKCTDEFPPCPPGHCMHTNVLFGGKSQGSIICCACCDDSSGTPKLDRRCKVA